MDDQQKLNEQILYELIKASSKEEVSELVNSHPFFKTCEWRNYGNLPNNFGIVNAQSPDPVGALVEKITNSVDALLVRKCREIHIDPTSEEALWDQREAIKKLLNIDVANFELPNKEIRALARKVVRINAEGTGEKPTLTIVDYGEGQHPSDFPSTFLSIGESNKIKIKFAHGVYNQGGSAALKFCGNGYQLILSCSFNRKDLWGFTLVRERDEPGYKAEWYEYCMVADGMGGLKVPSFPYKPLAVLPDGEKIESGSLVRLYSYGIRNPQLFVTGQREKELAREINKRYFSMPLPIEINELRKHLKGWSEQNKATRVYGFWRLMKKRARRKDIIKDIAQLQTELGVFGLRTIEIIIFNDEGDEGNSYRRQREKVFLTINGQAQHTETESFLKTKCLLADLAPYMVVHIDLSNAGHRANKIFRTDRSGTIANDDKDEFFKRLQDSIKGDEFLKELNREYKERKLKNAQPEDKDLAQYIGRLVKGNPLFYSDLKAGKDIPTNKPDGPKDKYQGEYIPTIFELPEESKIVPYNSYAQLRIKTDATDDYLTRTTDTGTFKWDPSNLVQIDQYTLKNGYIPIRIKPAKNVKPGDTEVINFELTRPGQESLKANIQIIIGAFKEPKINPSRPPKPPTSDALQLPERKYISKGDWEDWISPSGGHWDGSDIAEISEDHDGITVYINEDPDVLEEFPRRNPKYASGDMASAIKLHYLASVYLYAVAMIFEMKDEPETRELVIKNSLKAISKFILDLKFTNRTRMMDED